MTACSRALRQAHHRTARVRWRPRDAARARTGHVRQGGALIDYTVTLEDGSDRGRGEEAFTVRFATGRSRRIGLHEYDRMYAIPGLYEEVVHRRLRCASPAKLAEVLLSVAELERRPPHLLRVLDLGAGNGLVGEELHARGVRVLAATDSAKRARTAAARDRPGLYASYVLADANGQPGELGTVIRELGINCIVCAGALGFAHIDAHSFAELWDLLPPGAMFALTVDEGLARPGASEVGDELALLRAGHGGSEVVVWERFRHRLSVSGEPIHYVAIGARKRE